MIKNVILIMYTYYNITVICEMFKFFVKRLLFSLAIIAGVMLLTFILFNVATGDPAAALLGKNASPEELENMRIKLGSDLPVLFGFYRKSEVFSVPVMPFDLPKGRKLVVKRNFEPKMPLAIQLEYEGDIKNYPSGKIVEIKNNIQNLEIEGEGKILSMKVCYRQSNPFNSQYFKFLTEIVRFDGIFPYVHFFDMGESLLSREKITDILKRSIVPSLLLMLPVYLGELFFGILLALVAIAFKDSWVDRSILLFSIAGMSISYLVLIIFFQWFFGFYCDLFPVWGSETVRHYILPVICGIVYGVGGNVRFYRSLFANEFHREYMRTARAKGCSSSKIYTVHLLKNAAIPIIAQSSSTLPFLFTGSLLLESFFGIPGLGSASVDALNNADLQLLKALVLFSAVLFIIFNFAADFLYALVDPRVKTEE